MAESNAARDANAFARTSAGAGPCAPQTADSERRKPVISMRSGDRSPRGSSSLVACMLQASCPASVPAHRHSAVRHVAPRCAGLSRISRGFAASRAIAAS